MNNNKTKDFVSILKNYSDGIPFLEKQKFIYRPYLCPFDTILKLLEKNKTIFDIGCGLGAFSLLATKYLNPNSFKGIDISKDVIEQAKSLYSKLEQDYDYIFETYNGWDIPLDIGRYDYVTIIDVFHHINPKNQKEFILQLYKKMSPGSFLIMKDINKASPLVLMNKLHDLIISKEIVNEVSKEHMINILSDTGFNVIYESIETKLWYPHYTIKCHK
jgi:2-polyprenyl-3-methyl-5-hydroxy-6-metoxy-1,4-benzoquinol methylase